MTLAVIFAYLVAVLLVGGLGHRLFRGRTRHAIQNVFR